MASGSGAFRLAQPADLAGELADIVQARTYRHEALVDAAGTAASNGPLPELAAAS